MGAGGQLGQPLADGDVALVRRDHETRVRERRHLLPHGGHHGGGGVAHGRDRDPGPQVDQRVAVDVDEDAAGRPFDEHRQRRPHPGGHGGLPPGHQRDGPGTGHGGDQSAALDDLVGEHAHGNSSASAWICRLSTGPGVARKC
jgi:hypothetical protein